MAKAFTALFIIALTGCSAVPGVQHAASSCSLGEASYECQIERYNAVNAN